MSYVVGISLGQFNQPSAIAIIDNTTGIYTMARAERFPAGSNYPEISDRIKSILDSVGKNTPLVMDITGIGWEIVNYFIQAGLRPNVIIITTGTEERRSMGRLYIPKINLVGCVKMVLQTDRIKIPKKIKDSGLIVKELQNFRFEHVKTSQNNDDCSWREGDNDDYVLAIAVALWLMASSDPKSTCTNRGRRVTPKHKRIEG